MAKKKKGLSSWIQYIGVLRLMLLSLAYTLIAFRSFADGEYEYFEWSMVTKLIVPALVPIVFMVMLLNILMAFVFMSDKKGTERKRFQNVIGIDAFTAIVLLAAWLGFFMSIGE